MVESAEVKVGRRERKTRQTREALATAAWRLFKHRGFNGTTIEAIATAADVSQRTFFRYFDSKEDALYSEWRDDLAALTDRVLSRPLDEPPLTAIREAVLSLADRFEARRNRILLRHQLATDSRQVAKYQRNVVQPAWEEALAGAVAQRLGIDSYVDLRPLLYAGSAIAAFNAAVVKWLAADGVGWLPELVTEALDLLVQE